MRIERLRLTDFRNFRELDLALPGGLVVLRGRNAQGKTNLLEAINLAATSRSFRTTTDREVVRWQAPGHFARIDATVARRAGPLHLEVVVADGARSPETTSTPTQAAGSPPAGPPLPSLARKRIRVNGVPRRAMDLLGQVTIVVFTPTHLDLVTGGPSERRRFLDLILCQVNPPYCRALSQYQKVLLQRSALLRRIREGEESPQALTFWDEQLARLAIPVMRARAAFLASAQEPAARLYRVLSRAEAEEEDTLAAQAAEGIAEDILAHALVAEDRESDYTTDEAARAATGEGADLTAAREGALAERDTALGDQGADALGPLRLVYRPSYAGALDGDEDEVASAFLAALRGLRKREIAQGANVLGPHRDDVAFLAGEVDLAIYGSRGQQRSVALALKLAELEYMERETGEQPILLLDDVLSELDEQRRADLLTAVRALDQVILTTTDATSIPMEDREHAHFFRVRGGQALSDEDTEGRG